MQIANATKSILSSIKELLGKIEIIMLKKNQGIVKKIELYIGIYKISSSFLHLQKNQK